MDKKPEPQQLEGELVKNSAHCKECYYRLCCRIAKEAQLAHDKATMVKLPSDIDEFGLRLHHIIRRHVSFSEVDDEIILDDYAIAQELLRLLKGGKP